MDIQSQHSVLNGSCMTKFRHSTSSKAQKHILIFVICGLLDLFPCILHAGARLQPYQRIESCIGRTTGKLARNAIGLKPKDLLPCNLPLLESPIGVFVRMKY